MPEERDLPTTVSSSVDLPTPPAGAARTPGTLIARYLVVDQLGEGGMGVVYKAYDPELGRLVAIKRVRGRDPRLGSSLRLVREAQAVAQLSHPNVVAVHDVGEVDGDVYIAMEYVDGWRLREWLLAARRSQAEILQVFAQAAAGLAAAHDRGLVHRDFKPANVLVGYDGRVRVVDFGLARPIGGDEGEPRPAVQVAPVELALDRTLTPAGVALGTPRYMAPEQHLGAPLDGRADQFAFCVALFEALVGKPAFPARDMPELIHKVTHGLHAPIPRDAGVPRWLRKLLERGLEVAAADRFPTMHELLAVLLQDHAANRRAALGGEPHGEHMLAAFPPPDDDATAARVRELGRRLERARARKERGLTAEARALAEELLVDLQGLDYLPLRGATLYLVGELRHRQGEHAGARAALEDALRAAAAAGDDWQVASAWILLVLVVGAGLGRVEEAETLAAAAEIACLRVGENPALRARLAHSRGLTWLAAGRAREAAAELERALVLDEQSYGPRHWFVAVSLLHVAEAWLTAGDPARARPPLERAAGIVSPDSPTPSPTRARCRALLERLAAAS